MCLPNIIIAGAPKCGTTTLFDWLKNHPEICASKKKELRYFIDKKELVFDSDDNYHLHGLDHYKKFFKHCQNKNQLTLEATPAYIYQQTAIDIIPTFEPLPKIIFILREPAQRVYSQFKFSKYRLKRLPQSITFKEYLNLFTEDKDFVHLQGKKIVNPIKRSMYIKYLKLWKKQLPTENILIYLLEDIKRSPLKTMSNISRQVGVSKKYWSNYSFVSKNRSLNIRNKFLHKIGQKITSWIPNNYFKENIVIPVYNKINTSGIPPLTKEEKSLLLTLKDYFRPYNHMLNNTFGIDVKNWNQ